MGFVLQLFFFFIFLFFNKKDTRLYLILVLLQVFSFLGQFLVGEEINYDSPIVIFNIFFINICLFLIIAPWRYAKIHFVYFKNKKFIFFFKKVLYKVLFLNLILSLILLIVIRTYIPSIAAFKAEGAYRGLYDKIPYFANIFRYTFVTQNLGYFAIPFFFYYLSKSETSKSKTALIYSSSSIIAGVAFYSRAQIFTYILVFIGTFFLLKDTMPTKVKRKILKNFKMIISIIIFLFISLTITRFSEMDYYGDRISKNSKIKNPVVYSIADYAAQGYYNGAKGLEKYTEEKILYGEGFLRLVYQYLNFFGVISWDAEASKERVGKSFDYKAHLFYGYTCQMVYNFGYTFTFLLSLFFYLYIKRKLVSKIYISLESLFILVLLLVISIVSIFYCGFELLYIALLFLFFVRILYTFRNES